MPPVGPSHLGYVGDARAGHDTRVLGMPHHNFGSGVDTVRGPCGVGAAAVAMSQHLGG